MNMDAPHPYGRVLIGVMLAAWLLLAVRSPHMFLLFLAAILLLSVGSGGIDSLLSPVSRYHRRKIFLNLLFEMLGRLCKADGAVSEAEISRVEKYMQDELQLSKSERKVAIDAFRAGKESARACQYFIERFHQAFERQPAVLHGAWCIMQELARADGRLSGAEKEWLRHAQVFFGFTGTRARRWEESDAGTEQTWERAHQQQYRQTQQEARETAPDDPYAFFGMSRGAPFREFKRRYRELARQYHPDAAIAGGLPRKYVQEANEKFKKLQAAWAQIRQEHKNPSG